MARSLLRAPSGTVAAAALVIAVAGAGVACKKAQTDAPTTGGQCPTCVTADDRGFTPSRIELPAGAPGELRELTFTRTTDETCATEVVFPEIGLKQELPLKQPTTIKVPAGEKRTLTFTCGMGMYKSAVVIR